MKSFCNHGNFAFWHCFKYKCPWAYSQVQRLTYLVSLDTLDLKNVRKDYFAGFQERF